MEVHKEKIRWFRCVSVTIDLDLTVGKLYPATTVDEDGDLAIVDDIGVPCWVVITESHKQESFFTLGEINNSFEEVITDD